MKAKITLAGALLLSVLGLTASVNRPAAADAAVEHAFDRGLVAKGRNLSALGNCITCHTSEHGQPFAGARPLPTPFGTIYSTNITPEPQTGIGRWSEADFRRAMHQGVDAQGRDLYPAFPYDHFTRVTDDDVAALYAYLMTREPVRAQALPNRLPFPLGLRSSIRFWKAAYFRPGVYRPDPSRSAEWNRGAYLVEGLAHCGACHTPRNALGAEENERVFEGGESEGWQATALDRDSPARTRWTADQLYTYLRQGREPQHGTAAGPMADVTHNLADVDEADVRAIAAYVAAQMPDRDPAPAAQRVQPAISDGETIFAGACAVCHVVPSSISGGTVPLGLTTSLNAPDARNVIHVILEGLNPESGDKGPMMPGFAAGLTDKQVAALVDYLRAQFTDRPAWNDVPREVSGVRQSKEQQ
jgi:mono/diheme cytochrome c family protein